MFYNKIVNNYTQKLSEVGIYEAFHPYNFQSMDAFTKREVVFALYAIANELHELNSNFRAEVDNGK